MSVASPSINETKAPLLGAPGVGSLAVLIVGTVLLGYFYGPAQGALFLVGGALGIALYHAAFVSPPRGGCSSSMAADAGYGCR